MTMILGIGHKVRNGKDTAADYLVNRYGFTKLAFADALNQSLPYSNGISEAPKEIHKRLKKSFQTSFELLSLDTVKRNSCYTDENRHILESPQADRELEGAGDVDVASHQMMIHGEVGSGADWDRLATQWVTGHGVKPEHDACCFLEGRGLVGAAGGSRKRATEINEVLGLTSDNSFRGRSACEAFVSENHRKLCEHFVPSLALQAQSRAVKPATLLDTISNDDCEIIEEEGEIV